MKKHNNGKQKGDYPVTNDLIQKIKKDGIVSLNLKELLIPQGYAQKIVLENQKGESKLTRVQLRKIFNEFKNIEKKKNKIEIYKLYYILEYQANRKLISHKFKELLWTLLDELEKHFEDTEITKKIDEFITALVAYIPKE